MTFFYDPHAKRPHFWTYLFFIVLTLFIFLGIFLYGDRKAKQQESVAPDNSIFEKAED